MKKPLILGLLFCFSFLLQARIWTVQTVPNTKLEDARAYTSNPDGLLDAASQSEINNLLAQAETNLTAEIVVVALKSTGDIPLKPFATELFNVWGIGKSSKDNGLLILFVEDQKKVTFETGYGMEGVLPDAYCMRIIQKNIIPFMREGKYGEGLLSGVKGVLKILSDPKAANEIQADMEAENAVRAAQLKSNIFNALLIYLLLSLVVVVWSIQSTRKKIVLAVGQDPYTTYKTLISARAGYGILAVLFPLTMVFFLLWFNRRIKLFRQMPRTCPKCSKPLVLMTEQQEDVYLNPGQQAEEMVGSVDYDAWVCLDCGHRSFLSYTKAFTNYKSCPKCGFKTFAQEANKVTLSPTPFSCGEGVKIYGCANCHHEVRKIYTIPMIVVIPTKGGGSGSGGGFGGGSFGGGSSGGGGATGGWN